MLIDQINYLISTYRTRIQELADFLKETVTIIADLDELLPKISGNGASFEEMVARNCGRIQDLSSTGISSKMIEDFTSVLRGASYQKVSGLFGELTQDANSARQKKTDEKENAEAEKRRYSSLLSQAEADLIVARSEAQTGGGNV